MTADREIGYLRSIGKEAARGLFKLAAAPGLRQGPVTLAALIGREIVEFIIDLLHLPSGLHTTARACKVMLGRPRSRRDEALSFRPISSHSQSRKNDTFGRLSLDFGATR